MDLCEELDRSEQKESYNMFNFFPAKTATNLKKSRHSENWTTWHVSYSRKSTNKKNWTCAKPVGIIEDDNYDI